MIRTPIPQQQKLHLVYDQSPCEELYDHLPPYRWKCPTLAEFIRQLERGFGDGIDPSGLYSTGIQRDELLPPSMVRALCEQLGVPPEDFGV